MKTSNIFKLAAVMAGACLLGAAANAQVAVPSTFKHITIDGSFGDWSGVPLAFTSLDGPTNAIEYKDVYIANDQSNLYVRFTLYSPRPNAFANSYDNVFIDADNSVGTGFNVGGIGSSMLIQWGGGYQEKNGAFNEGGVNNLGWQFAGSGDSTAFEFAVSLGATFASDNTPVFSSSTLALLLEGDNTSYANTAFAPPSGGLVYTLAAQPTAPTSNLSLISLTNSTWKANAAGSDLGVTWLDPAYDDTVAGWTSGKGLFGYTTTPGVYPAIQTPLFSGPTTYYFRTHFPWTNDTANVAFVVTNYVSDGAVYYLNGVEVRRVRMPSGTVAYATAASSTNSPAGHADVFGVDGGTLQYGDNLMEVEAHQAVGSGADMVLGLSLTAAVSYPLRIGSTNLPANQAVLAGQPVTFASDIVGSGAIYYQWYFNGTNAILGANSASYTIAAALTNNVGTYSLFASNSLSTLTSRAATLTVSNTPVSISSQPASQVAVEGKPVTFSVVTTGTPLIAYQWYLGASPILNATNASYTINTCLPSDAGSYSVKAGNPANTVTSTAASLTVLLDTIPPTITAIAAGSSQILLTFSEPVDATTATTASKYLISGGITVSSAINTGNPSQITLNVSPALTFGTVYTLTVNGVKDLFGNLSRFSSQFARDITIDGSVDDWTGLTPVYSSGAPSGNLNAADFKDIYVYNDASYYYFRVTLWADIDPGFGQFPAYVNMFYNTDNDPTTGYSAIGSEFLVQSGYNYQEKNGAFNDGVGLNGLDWLSLPTAPGTNFEFRMSLAATFQDASKVFSTNQISFLFQGMTPSFAVLNQAPASGVISYTNGTPTTVAPLPLGKLSIASLAGGQAAVVWDPPGTLQQAPAVAGATWTNLPSATSPYVIPASGVKQFFRLVK